MNKLKHIEIEILKQRLPPRLREKFATISNELAEKQTQ